MVELINIIKYVCINYPFSQELSNARLTKIIYLCDWQSCKESGQQMTSIEWYFDNFGPYVNDVRDGAINSNELDVVDTINVYGTPKTQIIAKANVGYGDIDERSKKIIDDVMDRTKTMFWKNFIDYVYSTEPIKNNSRYSYLDLEKISRLGY